MAYRLIYTRVAVKDIGRLDAVVKKKIGKRLIAFSQNPFIYARKLRNSKLGMYRWRVGNYRVVFDVFGNDLVVLAVKHRRDVYRT